MHKISGISAKIASKLASLLSVCIIFARDKRLRQHITNKTLKMAQNLIQTQEQKLQQIQKLTQQQMLQVRLTEMPLPELEESVKAEIDDNPALEVVSPDDAQPV